MINSKKVFISSVLVMTFLMGCQKETIKEVPVSNGNAQKNEIAKELMKLKELESKLEDKGCIYNLEKDFTGEDLELYKVEYSCPKLISNSPMEVYIDLMNIINQNIDQAIKIVKSKNVSLTDKTLTERKIDQLENLREEVLSNSNILFIRSSEDKWDRIQSSLSSLKKIDCYITKKTVVRCNKKTIYRSERRDYLEDLELKINEFVKEIESNKQFIIFSKKLKSRLNTAKKIVISISPILALESNLNYSLMPQIEYYKELFQKRTKIELDLSYFASNLEIFQRLDVITQNKKNLAMIKNKAISKIVICIKSVSEVNNECPKEVNLSFDTRREDLILGLPIDFTEEQILQRIKNQKDKNSKEFKSFVEYNNLLRNLKELTNVNLHFYKIETHETRIIILKGLLELVKTYPNEFPKQKTERTYFIYDSYGSDRFVDETVEGVYKLNLEKLRTHFKKFFDGQY